jgi:hypothetical protein
VLSRVIADAASPIGGATTAGRIVSLSRCFDEAVAGLKALKFGVMILFRSGYGNIDHYLRQVGRGR